ncbi:hypothetical protein OAO62_01510 [Gammaproteobacteria bacterium]|nr:hypothetical protein [Gammaproteobacteria bacterium]
MKYFLSTILLLTSLYALSGHHALNEGLMPVAKPGQIIVTYKGECPADKIDESIEIVKQTIAYERKNSPVSYSSSPGTWSDGTVGAVDLHDSEEAMNKAFEWQANDKKWSDLYDQVAATCGITVEDFEVVSLTAR